MIDSVYRTGKNYYLQVFVEERKYAIKKKMPEYITDDILPDDSDRKILMKKIIVKKILMKKSIECIYFLFF